MRLTLVAAVAGYCSLLPFLGPQGQAPSLADDARVGAVVDRQGTALVRPVGRERWTPLKQKSVLLPGDQLRTPVRGANAVEVELHGGQRLVLGPGALLEIPERAKLRLYGGDLEVKAAAGKTVEVTGPGGFGEKTEGTLVLRAGDGKTQKLAETPRWLVGFRASTTDEWMGSLVAQVDGRAVPLQIGYHKVTVDIRDQIARTTVEESFVNTTAQTLEGSFVFPLPADASIGSFGMWIGDQLVEADVVEKQRARAIYEDMKRRRKDPGLLEWQGGNLFQARVWPIPARGEKRVRLQYTQVLPLEGTRLRYRYALKSEMLRRHPLRELQLAVHVSSATPLAAVASPTHEVRVRQTARAASAELSAQEYTPDRDFELAIDLEAPQPLVLVPHRRGEDGYFMLLFTPPGEAAAKWQRDLVPERGPLDLIVVADTSGSMDRAARQAQQTFVQALLASLGAKDTVRLLACDLTAQWWRPDAVAATAEHAEAALDFLAQRRSLGWSDLDLALAEVRKQAKPGTTVVYVGDGIGTAGDPDPVALAQRVTKGGGPGTFHAVSVAASFEKGVLEAIASLGGGSVRAAGDDPTAAALALLREVATPPIKDLRLTCEGLRTAAVYPERLPNLAPGTQQVVLGRFLPQGATQQGRIVVEGTLDGQPLRLATDVTLRQSEAGNSFLPRLWASRHAEALLAQGTTPEIAKQVVALSQEFGVLTPLTSFLVLENDEERERYGVTRQVRLRDGEQFFAEGRDRARTDLLRQQMQVARTWRLELRRQMLRELATLGEELVAAETPAFAIVDRGRLGMVPVSAPEGTTWTAGRGGDAGDDLHFGRRLEGKVNADLPEAAAPAGKPAAGEEAEEIVALDAEAELPQEARNYDDDVAGLDAKKVEASSRGRAAASPAPSGGAGYLGEPSAGLRRKHLPPHQPQTALMQRFPGLPPAPTPWRDRPAPSHWPVEVADLLRRLDWQTPWAATPRPLELRGNVTYRHPLRGSETPGGTWEAWLSRDAWLVRTSPAGSEPREQWLAAGKRGAVAAAMRLGRQRPAESSDTLGWPMPWHDFSARGAFVAYRRHAAELQRDGDRATVVLRAPWPSRDTETLVIDAARNVVLEHRHAADGRVTATTRFEGHVEAAERWIPTRISTLDDEGRLVRLETIEGGTPAAETIAQRLLEATRGHQDVLFLADRDPSLLAAKQAAFEKKAGFADELRLAVHFASTQQWSGAWQHWTAAEPLAKGLPGAQWLRADLLRESRRHPDLLAQLASLLQRLTTAEDMALGYLLGHTFELASVLAETEEARLLEAARPLWLRDGATLAQRALAFARRQASVLERLERWPEAVAVRVEIVAKRPFDLGALLEWATTEQHLDPDAAIQGLVARAGEAWTTSEAWQLHERITALLYAKRDLEGLKRALPAATAAAGHESEAWTRWLTVLLLTGAIDEADAWAKARLAAAIPEPADRTGRAQLLAAVRHALGHGWGYWSGGVAPAWRAPLADVVRRAFAKGEADLVSAVVNDWRLRRTDVWAKIRGDLLADLTTPGAIESLAAERIVDYLRWAPLGKDEVEPKVWRDVASRLVARSTAMAATVPGEQAARRELWGQALALFDRHGEPQEALALARQRLQSTGPQDETRAAVAQDLLQRLLREKWSTAHEAEAFTLLAAVQPLDAWNDDEDDERDARAAIAARTVRQLAGELYQRRYEALVGEPKDHEKLARAELRERQQAARAQARRELAASLGEQREKQEGRERPWLELERLGCLARAGETLADVVRDAATLRAATPDDRQLAMAQVARQRAAWIEAFAATRRGAVEAVVTRVVEALQALASSPEATIDAEAADPDLAQPIDWRRHYFRLLVALDRVPDVVAALEGWIVPARAESRWRVALGYLKAELGEVAPAIAAFETVAALDELRPAEHAALADWLLVVGDEARRETALRRRYETMAIDELYQRVQADRGSVSRQRRGAVPNELDPDLLRALRTLLERASQPENYLWQVRSLYTTTRDFRILACLPHALLGHTQQSVYAALGNARLALGDVQDEASCDAIAAAILECAPRAASDLDRRALDLLLAMVERRASEVVNQPGPHGAKGLAALERALALPLGPDEPLLLAQWLAGLGRIPQGPFAERQIAALGKLQAASPPASQTGFEIAVFLARTRWVYAQHDQAIDQLGSALASVRQAHGGRLPASASRGLEAWIGWLKERGRFAQADEALADVLAQGPTRSMRGWLNEQRFRVWVAAVEKGGSLAMGRGEELYRQARAQIEKELFADREHASRYIDDFCRLHVVARKAGTRAAAADLGRFAGERLPELLAFAVTEGTRFVRAVADSLKEAAGPKPALAVLIERSEKQPAFWARTGQIAWQQFGWQMARWRKDAIDIGDLEPRLLALVLAELERDLIETDSDNRVLYTRGDLYWASKEEDFVRVALKVVELLPESSASQLWTAEYLWSGVGRRGAAIDVLRNAVARGILREDGRWRLVRMLHDEHRYQDSLALLEALRAERPDSVAYRAASVRALAATGAKEAALALLAASRKRLEEQKLWNEPAIAALANACREGELWAQGIDLYEEAVRLHERSHANRGVGRGTTSAYYGWLAECYVALGDHEKAVDRAAAAIVAWGSRQEQRREALQALQTVVRRIGDLDAFVVDYDKKAQASGLDAPVLRKAFGQAYLARRESPKAVPQLLAARALQPHDEETHQLLLGAYDALGQAEAAREAIFASIDLAPRTLDLYAELAKRAAATGDGALAERARSTLVEMEPLEPEGHRRLAAHLESTQRLEAAILQWQQVVRLARDDPGGWLSLAKAQLAAGQRDEARQTLEHVLSTAWDARFGDVKAQAAKML